MARYYTPKLTEAQYFHVLDAMINYGFVDGPYCLEDTLLEGTVKLHERTLETLMEAQEKVA
jgi:hypothetical protein